MKLLLNPLVLRMGLVLLMAMAAFVLGSLAIHRLRKNLAADAKSLTQTPLSSEGLPVHAYHAVIQQLKQEKHQLTAEHLAERRRAKASDTLSATVLANLSCGVLFFNSSGLVRQANASARKLLGFASPVGMNVGELFRSAKIRPQLLGTDSITGVEEALAPALAGQSAVRGLLLEVAVRDGSAHAKLGAAVGDAVDVELS
jgi:nitrogen fixation/metabolism regulation signal transduction histidine kinase